MSMFLGIDLGTSGVKAVIADASQTIVAQAQSEPLSVSRPHALWSEQNPEDWWRATEEAVLALDPGLRSGVEAIGLSGQMHGAACLDDADAVIRPAILWNDGRSLEACQELMRRVPDLTRISGNLAMPGFTAPKLVWMRENEPEQFARIAKVLLPKDWLRLKMCGVHASDMSDSAGTLWMDVAARDWSDDLLAACDLDRGNMPELFEGTQATAQLRPDIAASWGMSGVPVAAGAGDNAAGAVGSGTVIPGTGFVSLGTSGVIFVSDENFRPNADQAVHTFCHALPKTWHRMGVVLSAASAINHVAALTGFASPTALFETVEQNQAVGAGPLFLPYLSGERTPHNNPHLKGGWYGIGFDDSSASLAASAVEGVSFALADALDAIRNSGPAPDALSVIGGGSRSRYWSEVLASCFDIPVKLHDGSDVGPAFGAARLARLSVNSEDVASVCTPPPLRETISPSPRLRERLSSRREAFTAFYSAMQEIQP